MIYVPHPSEVVAQTAIGTSGENMGDVTDTDSKCRFSLPVEKCFTIVYARAEFESVSSDTKTATMYFRVDNHLVPPNVTGDISAATITSPYDWTLHDINGVGIGSNRMSMRVQPVEYPSWTLHKDDVFVIQWTNPDDQRWAVEVGLWDTSRKG